MVKRFLILFILIAAVVNNSLASPLVFKVKKTIDSKELVELASFDATKYRQIRIGIKVTSADDEISSDSRFGLLISKRADIQARLGKLLMQYTERHPEVVSTKNEIELLNNQISELTSARSAIGLRIVGIEETNEVGIFELFGESLNRSIVIDTPPSKISIKVSGRGVYSLYVWGQ